MNEEKQKNGMKCVSDADGSTCYGATEELSQVETTTNTYIVSLLV